MATRYVCECGDSFTHKERARVEAWFASHVQLVHNVEPLRVWASYAPTLSQARRTTLRKLLRSWGVEL